MRRQLDPENTGVVREASEALDQFNNLPLQGCEPTMTDNR
jgi:hypothetical protein